MGFLEMLLNIRSQVFGVFQSQNFKLLKEVKKNLILLATVPALDANSILLLEVQIGRMVINYNHPLQVASHLPQILQVAILLQIAALSVESKGNVSLGVYFVQDPVRVLLCRGGENPNLEVLRQQLDELTGEWPHQEGPAMTVVLVVDQSLV